MTNLSHRCYHIYRTTTHPVTPLLASPPFFCWCGSNSCRDKALLCWCLWVRQGRIFILQICNHTRAGCCVGHMLCQDCSKVVTVFQRIMNTSSQTCFFFSCTPPLSHITTLQTKFCFTLYLISQGVEAPLHTLSPEFWPGHFGQNIRVLHIQGPRSYLCISLLSWAQAWEGLRNEKGESGAIKRESRSKAERMQLKDWVTDRSAKRQCD